MQQAKWPHYSTLFSTVFFLIFMTSLSSFALPYYLFPHATFPSGFETREELEKNTAEQLKTVWQLVHVRNESGWIEKRAPEAYGDTISLKKEPSFQSPVVKKISSQIPRTVIKEKTFIWARSYFKNTGDIWWDTDQNEEDLKSKIKTFSKEQIFKRKIFDIVTEPKAKTKFVASADGIFTSKDGNLWLKHEFFKNKNYPVAIQSGGVIFVGPYVSHDEGKTFHPYLKWDRIAKALTKSTHKALGELRIEKIIPQEDTKALLLTFSSGRTLNVSLETKDSGNSWSIR